MILNSLLFDDTVYALVHRPSVGLFVVLFPHRSPTLYQGTELVKSTELETPGYTQSHYYTDLFLNALEKKYLKPRDEEIKVHASELASCPRMHVFIHLDPNRQRIKDTYFKDGKPIDAKTIPLTERTLMYFYDGEAVDEKTRKEFAEIMGGNYDVDAHVDYGPITGTPDLVDLDRKRIIELKTTDPSAHTRLPKNANLRQLMLYMALMDYEHGTLWYHIITRKKDNELWYEFEISLSAANRTELRALLIQDGERQYNAKVERDPYAARHVADDPDLNWLCKDARYCPYAEKCPEGFAFKEQWFIDHPPKAKAGAKINLKDLEKKYGNP